MSATARAQFAPAAASGELHPGLTTDALDPVVELRRIQARRTLDETRRSLFGTSPLTPLRQTWLQAEQSFYEATDIKFATAFNHLFQHSTEWSDFKRRNENGSIIIHFI